MNWAGRSAWIYQDSTPDYDKIAKHRIDTVYIDPRSTNATAVIKDLRGHGVGAGVYAAKAWRPDDTPVQFSIWFSHQLQDLVPRHWPDEAPPAMLDLEGVTPEWATAAIDMYRKYQPQRPTAYTNAPFQGGLVPVAALRAASMPFFVQTYYGDMSACDPAAAVLEAARDYDARMVHPFYDGACLPADSRDGCVFTLERLP